MKWKMLNLPSYLNLISAIILLIGLGSAVLIYQRAGNEVYGVLGYETVNGTIYPIMPQDSKIYRHNLQLYGGTLNVIMDDFNRWFFGLWHGKSLAFIIGFTTIIISFCFFYRAKQLAESLKSEVHSEASRDGTE